MKRKSTAWPHYACDWSSASFCTLAVGSFLPSSHNYIQVLSLPSPSSSEFQVTVDALPIEYVATKLLWSPGKLKGGEYLAASGDGVYIWKVGEPGYTLTGRLVSRQTPRRASEDFGAMDRNGDTNPPAPVTSFDWNKLDPTLLVTASYDTTCTVWCLETGSIRTQLIAHDKEVFDVSFSPVSTDTFVSVGADGSLRLFDTRTLDHSTIIYESADARPLLRVQWNPNDPNYLATFAADSSKAVVMDIRMPSVPAAELMDHSGPVVALRWSPSSSSHIMTADENTLRLWDLAEYDKLPGCKWAFEGSSLAMAENGTDSMLDPVPLQSILWTASSPDWIGVTSTDQITIMRI
ncbi:hypothetical protein PSACC_01842 [Paramicrosporidium saccamoebae]|uniref:Uncharacterized protein n=1 Tax=Paramicrosporidium saccamoebae TaxID=1246581 RepID=A0A2H9TKS0_9FUNG|nr:hypothetical protein PSACC_01842 [Paramicrosporidium saccamoebae]